MKARRVHAVMAAGLADPESLHRWRQEPALLRELGLEPDEVDLEALWKFAGLSEKIRHNGCRSELPLTFRLLNKAGLEIDLFANYARRSIAMRKGGPPSTEDRITALIAFLEEWLDPEIDTHVLVWDLIRHEATIAQLKKRMAQGGASTAPGSSEAVSAEGVPMVAGVLRLWRMTFDPRLIAERLRQQPPRLADLPRDAPRLGYWWSGGAPELRILELDELGYSLLSAVDGVSSVTMLAGRLGGEQPLPLPRLLEALGELVALGLITFQPGTGA